MDVSRSSVKLTASERKLRQLNNIVFNFGEF